MLTTMASLKLTYSIFIIMGCGLGLARPYPGPTLDHARPVEELIHSVPDLLDSPHLTMSRNREGHAEESHLSPDDKYFMLQALREGLALELHLQRLLQPGAWQDDHNLNWNIDHDEPWTSSYEPM